MQRRKAQQKGDVSCCVPSSDDVKLSDYDDLAPAGMEACCPQARLYERLRFCQTSSDCRLDGLVVAIDENTVDYDDREQTNCLTESLGTINLGVVPFC